MDILRAHVRKLTVMTCIYLSLRRSAIMSSSNELQGLGIGNVDDSQLDRFFSLVRRKALVGVIIAFGGPLLFIAACIYWKLPPFVFWRH